MSLLYIAPILVFKMSKDLQFALEMATHLRKIAWSIMEWLIRGKYLKIITIWMYFQTYDLCFNVIYAIFCFKMNKQRVPQF